MKKLTYLMALQLLVASCLVFANWKIESPKIKAQQDSPYIKVPKTFTPDGDGVDDLLAFSLQSGVKLKSFDIVSVEPTRPGHNLTIFETSSPTRFWDGKEGDSMMPEGDYWWHFEGEYNLSPIKTGGVVKLARKVPQDPLLKEFKYSSNSVTYDSSKKTLRLYGSVDLNYKDEVKVKAEFIEVDLNSFILTGQKGGYTTKTISASNADYFRFDLRNPPPGRPR